jgi:TonB family protein
LGRLTFSRVAAREEISMAATLLLFWLGLVLAQGPEPFSSGFATGAYRVSAGIIAPIPKRTPAPIYTAAARDRRIVGEVELLAVVLPDGAVGAVRRLTSLDAQYGLDDEAVAVAKQYLFEPGRKDGVAVSVVATIFVTFQLPDVSLPMIRVIGGTADPPEGLDTAFTKGALPTGPGVTRPLPLKKVYPARPTERPVSGQVGMVAVVRGDGTVADVKVQQGLDPGLDAAAESAVRAWVFDPPTRNGTAVSVVMWVYVDFSPRSLGKQEGL